jgi:hypothetical protein
MGSHHALHGSNLGIQPSRFLQYLRFIGTQLDYFSL